MPKKPTTQGGDSPSTPEKRVSSTKVSAEILRKAKTVAAHRDIDLYDYLESVLEGPVSRDYTEIIPKDPRGQS